jgi:hypothetical protein
MLKVNRTNFFDKMSLFPIFLQRREHKDSQSPQPDDAILGMSPLFCDNMFWVALLETVKTQQTFCGF